MAGSRETLRTKSEPRVRMNFSAFLFGKQGSEAESSYEPGDSDVVCELLREAAMSFRLPQGPKIEKKARFPFGIEILERELVFQVSNTAMPFIVGNFKVEIRSSSENQVFK